MSVKNNTNSILRGLDKYKTFLDGLTDEEFQRTPAEGVWSYSEVYSHILTANTGSLIAIERCLHGNKSSSGSLELIARLILFFGRLPPGKFKVPEKVGAMVRKITLEEARNDIINYSYRESAGKSKDQTSPSGNAKCTPMAALY
jgi:hypothetical protein